MKNTMTRRGLLGLALTTLSNCTSVKANNALPAPMTAPQIKRTNLTSHVAFETSDEIIINRPMAEVFSFVTNLNNSDRISDHVENTQVLQNGNKIGGQYSRNLLIHGFKNAQIVTITDLKKERLFQTSTELFGILVVQTYRFSSDGEEITKIDLLKQSLKGGWLGEMYQPFVAHQLTRGEHDGQHLSTLKKAVETA